MVHKTVYADVARVPDVARGCDTALRPHGRAAGWPMRGAPGRGHVAGGHACPRESTWAPVWGATWQGVSIWRAHGLVGPW